MAVIKQFNPEYKVHIENEKDKNLIALYYLTKISLDEIDVNELSELGKVLWHELYKKCQDCQSNFKEMSERHLKKTKLDPKKYEIDKFGKDDQGYFLTYVYKDL